MNFRPSRPRKRRFGSLLRRVLKSESGSMITVAAVLPLLLGTAGLAIDTGRLYVTKRQMEIAADAAALAGSFDRLAGKTTATITSTALYEARRNGFQNGVENVSIAVNSPPSSGPNASVPGAVEVIITKPVGLTLGAAFEKLLGFSTTNVSMVSRAVAAQSGYTSDTMSPEGCFVALTTANEQGISVTSLNNFNSDCTVISNGTATGSGSNASINFSNFNNATMKSIWARGSFAASSYNHLYLANPVQQNQATAVDDPYGSLPVPAPGGCGFSSFNQSGSGSSITLVPGTYCGGLKASGYNNIYFSPGVYYVANGDLVLKETNNISCPRCANGTGVTFVLTTTTGASSDVGGVTISDVNNVTLNPPVPCSVNNPPSACMNEPLFPGLLFYQDRRATQGTMTSPSRAFVITSVNNAKIQGGIYVPQNRIDITNLNNISKSNVGCTVWVGRYVKFSLYNNNYIAGCDAGGTKRPAIRTSANTYKSKVLE